MLSSAGAARPPAPHSTGERSRTVVAPSAPGASSSTRSSSRTACRRPSSAGSPVQAPRRARAHGTSRRIGRIAFPGPSASVLAEGALHRDLAVSEREDVAAVDLDPHAFTASLKLASIRITAGAGSETDVLLLMKPPWYTRAPGVARSTPPSPPPPSRESVSEHDRAAYDNGAVATVQDPRESDLQVGAPVWRISSTLDKRNTSTRAHRQATLTFLLSSGGRSSAGSPRASSSRRGFLPR